MTAIVALLMSSVTWAGISVTPNSVTKSQVKVGTVSDQILVIRKSGTNSTVDSVGLILGAAQWNDSLIDPIPVLLSGGDSVAVRVRFSPTSTATVRDTLRIYWDTVNTVLVPLSGSGALGVGSTSTATLPFDTVVAGSTKPDSFMVYNTGTASLQVRLAMAAGSPYFVALPDSFAVIPGDSQQVVVSFTPDSSGAFAENLLVMTDAKAGVVRDDTITVALSGTGVAPAISFQPVSLDFGDLLLGSTADSTFTISNPGTSDLVISAVSGYTVEYVDVGSPGVPLTVPAGSTSAAYTVRFSPAASGVRNNTIQFTTNIPGQSQVDYAMTGNGVNPDIDVTPLTYDFGEIPVQSVDTLTITVRNLGSSDLTISSVNLQLGLTEYTIVQTIPQNTVLSPGGGQPELILVEVAPTLANLTLSDTVVIVSDDPDEGTVKVSMTAVTVEALFALSDSTVTLGSVFIGESRDDTVHVINDGSDTLSFTSTLSNNVDFTVTPLTGDVLAGESLQVVVSYHPTAVGVDTSTWRLTTNAPASPQLDVALSGSASSRLGTPLIVNFGNVVVGQSSLQALIVQNLSTNPAEPIPIKSIVLSAGFELVDPPVFPDTLAAQAAETLMVRFSPLSAGAAAGTASIVFTEPTLADDTVAVPLAGTGVASARTIVRVINYPNPFVPDAGTTILVGLGEAAAVSITVYDLGGQVLAEPMVSQSLGAGEHEVAWNGRRYDGQYVAFGVYICEVVAVPSGGGDEDREFRKLACGRR